MNELRELLAAAPDSGPWIRKWESLDVHGLTGDGVLTDQRNVDLAVAAVNALPALLDRLDILEEVAMLTGFYMTRYGLANTSGERHEDRKERVRDIRAALERLGS